MKNLAPLVLVAATLVGCASASRWKQQAFAFSLPVEPPAGQPAANTLALQRVSISPLFQSRSFTYRTADNSYEHDPYAGFLIPPERALAEPIRAWLRGNGAFGRFVEPGSGLTPNLVAEVSISELYGDFRKASQPAGTLAIRFVFYESKDGAPGRVLLDKTCAHETRLAGKTPGALMAAWETDLRAIMEEINSAYAKTNSSDR